MLCNVVFCEHNAVPLLSVAANGNRLFLQVGALQYLNGCIKIIKVAVQNNSR